MRLIASPFDWVTTCVLLWQVGRQEPVMVLRVDKEKGYIDLSKRRVAAEDIQVLAHCLFTCWTQHEMFVRVR